MIRLLAIALAACLGLVGIMVAASILTALSLARDEDAHQCDGVCPACDPGPDDLEAGTW